MTSIIFKGIERNNCVYLNTETSSINSEVEPSLIVVGDSHADSTISAVTMSAYQNNKEGVLFYGMPGCLTVTGLNQVYGRNDDCYRFAANLFESISNKYIQTAILLTNRLSYYCQGHLWGIDLVRFITEKSNVNNQQSMIKANLEVKKRYLENICQLASKRKLYITKPIPEFNKDIAKTIARSFILDNKIEKIVLTLDDYYARNEFVLNMLDEASLKCGVTLIDPVPYLCDEDYCIGSHGNRPLYYDDHHLS